MNLIEDDVLVFLYILDNPKCTITDIIKEIYVTSDSDVFKRMDNRLRNRINLMVEDFVVIKINGYSPARYEANPLNSLRDPGEIALQDSEGRILTIEPRDYIAVSGPDDRITICPLPSDDVDEPMDVSEE